MNWFKKSLDWLLGIPMVCIGVAVLAASYFTGLSHVNAVLLTGFGLVLGGAIAWVWIAKGDEPLHTPRFWCRYFIHSIRTSPHLTGITMGLPRGFSDHRLCFSSSDSGKKIPQTMPPTTPMTILRKIVVKNIIQTLSFYFLLQRYKTFPIPPKENP